MPLLLYLPLHSSFFELPISYIQCLANALLARDAAGHFRLHEQLPLKQPRGLRKKRPLVVTVADVTVAGPR